MNRNDLQPETQAIHAGQIHEPRFGAVGTPIYQTTTFLFTPETYRAIAEQRGREIAVYSRYGNPNQWAVQEKMAALEGAESSLVTASGMSAISATLLGLLGAGDHVSATMDVYGGTAALLRDELPRLGIEVSWAEPDSAASVAAALRPHTKLVYCETLSNPLLKLAPVPELAALAHAQGALLAVDNTFLTPVQFRPLAHGADLVIHSATKYLGGHSDLMAGVVSGRKELIDLIWSKHILLGGTLEPPVAFLLERSLKTLPLRVRAQRDSAAALAGWLAGRPEVARVIYPGQAAYPQAELASSLLPQGATGMLSFVLHGGNEAALALLDHLRLATQATSLGGVETLISLPFNTSHATHSPEEQAAIGLVPGLVRLSVGLEAVEDLQADLAQALARVAEVSR